MEFIDLEDEYPKKQGVYWVKIHKSAGYVEGKADWVPGKGFQLWEQNLLDDEYIVAWKQN